MTPFPRTIALFTTNHREKKMEFSTTNANGTTTLAISGVLVSATFPKIESEFSRLMDRIPRRIIVDFTHLQAIDSGGLAALSMFAGVIRASGGTFAVINPDGQPLAMLRKNPRIEQILCPDPKTISGELGSAP